MTIKVLLKEINYTIISGDDHVAVTEVVYDSRKVSEGCIFVCIQGSTRDSHDLIPDVIQGGTRSIVVEKDIPEFLPLLKEKNITVVRVDHSRNALAYMAAAYFGNPAKKLSTIGLTGTKGKTTTSYMIQSILEQSGAKVGVIGTIGAVIDGIKQKTANTTPESFELQRLFSEMVEAGCTYCVMEVSSQGLKMNRVDGFTFDIGVFTNFSSDHIGPDEHASMEEYLYCKSLLFKQCKLGIINSDDPSYEGAIKDHTCEIKTFGLGHTADLQGHNLELVRRPGLLGVTYQTTGVINRTIQLATPGIFSVYNSLAALLVCNSLGIQEDTMLLSLSTSQVRGRVEILPVAGNYTMMIDYAHNEASVESLLTTILDYKPNRIICVYGGGGNRSKLRRYAMGELCGKMADLSILTCDNSRNEEVADINNDIKVGLAKSNGNYVEIIDRTEAIHYSMDHAKEGDIIILLGKGHEDYQEIKGKKYYFCEKEVVEQYRKEKSIH